MLEVIALTFEFLGKILIGISVLFVHSRVSIERKIDKQVLREMKKEKLMIVLGILFLAIGYFLHLFQSLIS